VLISFSVENFRSYREKQTLSLLADESDELLENTIPLEIAALRGKRVLRTAAIYGANASGKSNFIRAFEELTKNVRFSVKDGTSESERLPIAFGLDENWRSRPSHFSATFVIEGVLYVYELECSDRVFLEELTAFPKTHPQRLFRRTVNQAGESEWHFSRTHFRRDRDLEKRTRATSLYVSVGAMFNHPLLSAISEFFCSINVCYPRTADSEFSLISEKWNVDAKFANWVREVLTSADTGIADVRTRNDRVFTVFPNSTVKSVPTSRLEVAHRGARDNLFWWTLGRESDGTNQLLSLLRSWYGLARENKVVLVDELDDSLHPLLSRQLLRLINAKENRGSRGQLIFTTHDSSLLDPTLLRRDQIFFAEKSSEGATKLYSLLEYRPRRGEPLQKGYLAGRYGAIPFLGDFKFETGKRKAAGQQKAAAAASHRRKST
jgi:hypothetical protein